MVPETSDADRPAWLDVDDLGPVTTPSPRRRSWLFAVAALPWLLVAGLLLRPSATAPDGSAVPVAGPEPATASASPAATDPASALDPTAPDVPGATILSSGALVAVDEDEARAVAVVAARRWLTTVGPTAADDGATVEDVGDGVYAEHLVVEGVDHPAPGAAVVTIRAVVLRVAGDGYDGVEVRRLAVPLRFDAGGAAPAGTPWLLPLDDAAPAPFEPTEVVDDPDLLLLAGEALADAGYQRISVRSLHRTGSWPLVVTADVAVDDAPARTVVVWLRPHLGRLVVAGTRPRPPAPASPSDLPSSSDPTEPEEVAP